MATIKRVSYKKYWLGEQIGGLSGSRDPWTAYQDQQNAAMLEKSRAARQQAAATGVFNGASGAAQAAGITGMKPPKGISPGAVQGFGAIAGIGAGILDASNVPDDYARRSTGKAIGSGALSGAATGASIGSFFPGYGTIIGGAVGAVAGAAYGGISTAIGNRKGDRMQNRDNASMATAKQIMDARRYIDEPGYGTTGREWFARKGGPVGIPYMKTRPVYRRYDEGGPTDIAPKSQYAPEDYYQNSAKLQHYKGILNEKLKARNPEAYANYFKGLQGARQAGTGDQYVQNTPYNEFLPASEVKTTLGADYDNYISSLKSVNQYDVSQGRQPLWGTVEGNQGVENLNYGRRFASLQSTPRIGIANADSSKTYARQYTYNPATRGVDVSETGDQSMRPMGFYPPGTQPKRYGGYVQYGKGGTIHIKPENRGKFTAYKKRTGKTTTEALHSKDPHVRKMANFARNAKKWGKK